MTPRCEVVTEWGDGGSPNSNTYCGKPAVGRVKGLLGYRLVCEEHAVRHHPYVERIPEEHPAA